MSDKYILDGHSVVLCKDLIEWASWFEDSRQERRVAADGVSGSRVSTVFVGVDQSYGDGPPLLFETMVFGGSLDGEMERCSTWEQAEKQHAAMVERVKSCMTSVESIEETEQENASGK